MNSAVKMKDFKLECTQGERSGELSLSQFVRTVSRSIVSIAVYDHAMMQYCQRYFDSAGVDDLAYRHDVCSKLRGSLAFSTLWAIYLDSADFRQAYEGSENVTPPSISGPSNAGSPSVFAKLAEDFHSPTEKESKYGNVSNALSQQVRLIARKAKEIELVEYVYVTRVKSSVFGTPKLAKFFMEDFASQLDDSSLTF